MSADLEELLLSAGSDSHAGMLLTLAYNAAVNETPVSIPAMLRYCADPAALSARSSMPVLCGLLVNYIDEWRTADARQLWETEIVSGLFTLRTGQRACVDCLRRHGVVTKIHAARPYFIDCDEDAAARDRRLGLVAS